MRGLQDVPGDGGRIHPAAQHGNHVGGEDETQRSLTEDGTHLSTLAEVGGLDHSPNAGSGICSAAVPAAVAAGVPARAAWARRPRDSRQDAGATEPSRPLWLQPLVLRATAFSARIRLLFSL